jgi:hypothetical protein
MGNLVSLNSQNQEIRVLRVCYWWGILADAVMAVLMLFPGLFTRFMRIDLAPGPGLSYGLRMGAPLMIGWTALLFWADRKPVARRDILLLTLPVILGYVLIELYSLVAGLAYLEATIPLLAIQAGMISLFIFGYVNATDSPREE